VKTMQPTRTWTAATQDAVVKFNPKYVHAQPGADRFGGGSIDMWNPQLGGVVYP